MNRAEKRRQEKLAKKAAGNARLGKATSPSPGQQKPAVQQALDLAVQHHTAGRLPQAESIYQQVLLADPNQPTALHLLGVIAHQGGKNHTAVDLITKALAIQPDYVEAHYNLGSVLNEMGKLDDAVASYRHALAIEPDNAEAHYNLGKALKDLGKLWARVPVVTVLGTYFASRVSASLLDAVGLTELTTHDLENYQALALGLARNPDGLGKLRAKLARNRLSEPLFDTPRFVGNLESAYRLMWNTFLSGNPPSGFDVIEESRASRR